MKTKHLLTATGLLLSPLASGAVINVDFGTTITSGNINNLASTVGAQSLTLLAGQTETINDLIDTTGASTGIGIELEATGDNLGAYANTIGNAFTGPYDSAVTDALGTSATTALGDGVNVTNNATPTVTLSGLSSAFTYEVIIFNARGAGTGGSWTYTLTDGSGTQAQTDAQILNNDEVTVFSGLVPDANGEITTVFSKNGNSRGGINFIQIVTTPVPEPSALLLSGLGFLALLRRKR